SAALSGDTNNAATIPPATTPNTPPATRLGELIVLNLLWHVLVTVSSLMLSCRILLAPAGGHLLAERGACAEKILTIGAGGRAFADPLGLEIGDDRVDPALRQLGGGRRRLLVSDLGAGHAKAVFALGPGELVEMWHRGPADHAATDDLDQLIVVELGF